MKCSLLSASRRIVPPIAATNKSERKAQEEVAFEAQQKQTKGENPWKYKKRRKNYYLHSARTMNHFSKKTRTVRLKSATMGDADCRMERPNRIGFQKTIELIISICINLIGQKSQALRTCTWDQMRPIKCTEPYYCLSLLLTWENKCIYL